MRSLALALIVTLAACGRPAPKAPKSPPVEYAHMVAKHGRCIDFPSEDGDSIQGAVCQFGLQLAFCRVGGVLPNGTPLQPSCDVLADFRIKEQPKEEPKPGAQPGSTTPAAQPPPAPSSPPTAAAAPSPGEKPKAEAAKPGAKK